MEPQPQSGPAVPFETPKPRTRLPSILIILVLLVLVGAGGILLGKRMASTPNYPKTDSGINPIYTDTISDWRTYSNSQYGFSFKYPAQYSETGVAGGPDNALVAFYDETQDTTVLVALSTKKFTMANLHSYAPTGSEDVDPVQASFGDNTFYYYGPGGGGVAYPDRYFYNLDGNILYFQFNGPYENDKTPNAAAKSLASQILSTFKFTNDIKVTSRQVFSPPLLAVSNWKSGNIGSVSFKYPPNYTFTSTATGTGAELKIGNDYSGGVSINVNTYDGGSRRQWYAGKLGENIELINKYSLAEEVKLGNVDALDFWMDRGWWQGGGTSPIIISNGTTIVTIVANNGRTYNIETGERVRWNVLDTIGSTIIFN